MNEKTINEYVLKLTGKVSLPHSLTISKSYQITVNGDITESRDIDNQDGTLNREFKIEPLTVEMVNDKGDSMKAKDKSKMHQKVRGRHHVWATENNSDMDYEEFGRLLIRNFDDVMAVINLRL